MTELRSMLYTKDNGDSSKREVLIVAEPRVNYLMLDVTKLSNADLDILKEVYKFSDEYRDNAIADFELLTGIKHSSLWRSFKPEGIEWNTEDEI